MRWVALYFNDVAILQQIFLSACSASPVPGFGEGVVSNTEPSDSLQGRERRRRVKTDSICHASGGTRKNQGEG